MRNKTTELEGRIKILEEAQRLFAEHFRQLRARIERLEKTAELHRAHLGIRPQQQCPKCRAPLHTAAKACPRCGASWDSDETESEKRGMPR